MSPTDAAPQKMIFLKSSDGEIFEVEEAVACESQIIKHMNMIDDCFIPLPNVTSKILAKVIEYCERHVVIEWCKRHVDDAAKATADGVGALAYKVLDEDLKAFDAEFVMVDQDTLFDLILAANYLNIKSLLDLTCQTVADMIKGKTPEEIRKTFKLKNDLTPEEEVRRQNSSDALFCCRDI